MDNCGGQSYDGAVNMADMQVRWYININLTLVCQNYFIFGQIYFGGN